MGSNEEQILLLVSANVDHVSYSLTIYSLAFVVYFCNFLLSPKLTDSRIIPDMALHGHRTECQPQSAEVSRFCPQRTWKNDIHGTTTREGCRRI